MKRILNHGPILMAVALLTGAAGFTRGDESQLVVRKNSVVNGPDVLLSDVAARPADLPEGWGGRAIMKSPAPGKPQDYPLATLAYALQKYPDMAEVSLRGDLSFSIQREGTPLEPSLFSEAIRSFVEQDDEWRGKRVDVECEPPRAPVLAPTGARVDLKVDSFSEEYGSPGFYKFTVSVRSDEKSDRIVAVRARITPLQEFWAAAQPIERGRQLAVEDLKPVWRPAGEGLRKGLIPVTEAVEGFQIERPVRLDQPLFRHYLQQPLCAQRGESIAVTAEKGALRIHLRARALGDGRMGDKILCLNERSQRRLLVLLTGSRQAQLDL